MIELVIVASCVAAGSITLLVTFIVRRQREIKLLEALVEHGPLTGPDLVSLSDGDLDARSVSAWMYQLGDRDLVAHSADGGRYAYAITQMGIDRLVSLTSERRVWVLNLLRDSKSDLRAGRPVN